MLIYGGRYRCAAVTDVRPEWTPFLGPEIYLWVYFFILNYMNTPNVHIMRLTSAFFGNNEIIECAYICGLHFFQSKMTGKDQN